MPDIQITVTKDTATAAVADLALLLASRMLRDETGKKTTEMTQRHLRQLPPNKMGWPSLGFYKDAANGTDYVTTDDGFVISVDNENAPGAMKHQYNLGQEGRTTINMKDKLLTIPARQEFYGKSAGQFANLRFGMFANGTKFLYIGQGGADRVNFQTGRSHSDQRGIGARSAMMVAFWLKESVEQDAKPEVLPTKETYLNACRMAIEDGLAQMTGRNN